MGRVISGAERLKRCLDGTLAFVHHSGKNVKAGARGSSALKAAVDTELMVERRESNSVLEITKQKDAEEAAPMNFMMREVELADARSSLVPLKLEIGELPPKDTSGISANAEMALLALGRIREVGEVVQTKEWQAACEKPGTPFQKGQRELVEAGLVDKRGRGEYSLTKGGAEVLAKLLPFEGEEAA